MMKRHKCRAPARASLRGEGVVSSGCVKLRPVPSSHLKRPVSGHELKEWSRFSRVFWYMNETMPLTNTNLFPTRYSLLGRLQDWSDDDSWRDFFETYWRLIYATALKSGLSESEAQDVVQETIISVAKDLHKFERVRKRGSFKGWLRNIIRWRIADQFRKRMRHEPLPNVQPETTFQPTNVADIPDPAGSATEAAWDEEVRVSLLDAALKNIRPQVREEYFQMFDLYVVKHWPPGRIAQALGVNVGQVYLAKHRVARLVKREIRRLEEKWG
jgi:RNA polymerase sigma factor (sigma-70 family)